MIQRFQTLEKSNKYFVENKKSPPAGAGL